MLALRDLSIRGDFRTTVEYLITLLESTSFKDNSIDTAWLDTLIAERRNDDKPDILLGVIAGSLHIADRYIVEAEKLFRNSLEKYVILTEIKMVKLIAKIYSLFVEVISNPDLVSQTPLMSILSPTKYVTRSKCANTDLIDFGYN